MERVVAVEGVVLGQTEDSDLVLILAILGILQGVPGLGGERERERERCDRDHLYN